MVSQLEPSLCYNCGKLVLLQIKNIDLIAMLVFLRDPAVDYSVLAQQPN